MNLRPYQLDAIERVRERIREGQKKVLVVAPTGAGKTIMFSEILSKAAERGSRSIVLAHRRELVAQTAAKVLACGVEPGVIASGIKPARHRSVQVASLQTLLNRSMPEAEIIVVDEAHHHTMSSAYQRVISAYPNAIVLGFTATPWRLDGAGLADVYPSSVLVASPRELRELGFLVPVGGWQYAPIDTRNVKVKGGDYDAKGVESAAMSAKLFGEIVGEWKEHAGGVRTVLFACTIRHSMALAQAFRDAGVAAEHLDGETPTAERDAILARVKSGATRVLCNVNVATEGWDCPELECCILARPTLSTSLYLQMVGRVLRPFEGKTMARIHDHARCLATHGHPYAERDYSPEKSMRASRKDSEAGVSRVLKCDKCGSATSRWPCDACSWVPPETNVEHQLAAKRVAIVDVNTPKWSKETQKAQEMLKKAATWKLKTLSEKRHVFEWLVQQHGERPAVGIYRAMSGESEWPPYSWRTGETARVG
jgi:DNA repair protein RadD